MNEWNIEPPDAVAPSSADWHVVGHEPLIVARAESAPSSRSHGGSGGGVGDVGVGVAAGVGAGAAACVAVGDAVAAVGAGWGGSESSHAIVARAATSATRTLSGA